MPYLALSALTVSAALTTGMVMALLGNVKLALARRPDRADRQVRNLLTLLNLLLIPLVIVAGLLVDRWGVRPMMVTGSVILTLAFLAFGAGLNYERTLLAVLAAAVGACALHVATIVQLPRGLFGISEVAGSLELGLVFIALGGLVAPPLLDLLLGVTGFRRTMAVLALLFLIPAFLAALVPADGFPEAGKELGQVSNLLVNPAVLLAGMVFFFYAPLEAFVSVWVATYLTNLGQPEKQTRWLACFWGAMLSSRLLFAILLHATTLGDSYLGGFLIFPALLSAVILGNMSGTRRYEYAIVGLTMLGFFLGPLFPMLLGILFKIPLVAGASGNGSLQGSAYGLLFAFGSIGSLVLSPLVRFSASHRTIQAALRIPLFLALVLTASTLMFYLISQLMK